MRRLTWSWPLAVVLTIATGYAATGCGGLAREKPAVVTPADFLKVVTGAATLPTVEGARRLSDDQAWLSAPHYRARFDWVAVVDRLDAGLAPVAGADAPVRAADGHELVMAGLDDFSAVPPWDDPKAKVTAVVAVGERTVKLDAPPAARDAMVVSAPKGAPVSLRITDADRTFGYDLRTGRAQGGQYWSHSTDAQLTYRGSGRLVVAPLSRSMEVSVSLKSVHLGAWTPWTGWSKAGRAWLHARVTGHSTALSTAGDATFPCTFSLDTARTFTITQPDGRKIRPLPRLIDVTAGEILTGVPVTFDVPADFRTGTLRLTPDGPITATVDRGKVRLRWSRPPPAEDFPITI